MERGTQRAPVAEAVIYGCSLVLLTARSSRRCPYDAVSSRELNTDMAEAPPGPPSQPGLSPCTLLCAHPPLCLASLEPLDSLS